MPASTSRAPFPDWRNTPVPPLEPIAALREGARSWPIASADPAFSEPLVDAAAHNLNGRNHYAHPRNPPYYFAAPGAIDRLLLRKGVVERLAAVDKRLGDQGLRLFLYDGWRPRAVQTFFHDVWTPAEIARRRPDLTGEALAAEVGRYWAAPSVNEASPAPHATGGAVDLTIQWENGPPLFMGSLFDDASEISHTDHFERRGDESFSAAEARANRRVLYWAMTEAGFVNHPEEWWHYSYGDQAWAKISGAPAALYGLIEAP